MSEKFLVGKTALVAGSSRGIGRAVSLKLAAGGVKVTAEIESHNDVAPIFSLEADAL